LVLRPAKHHPHSRCGYGYGAGTMTLSSGSGTCSRPRIAYSLNRECEIPNSRENSEKTEKKEKWKTEFKAIDAWIDNYGGPGMPGAISSADYKTPLCKYSYLTIAYHRPNSRCNYRLQLFAFDRGNLSVQ